MNERDRFELLTAYLDGEVTAAERRQIDDWLRTDLEVQRLYVRALQLRSKWQIIPTQRPVKQIFGQAFPRSQTSSKIAGAWCSTVLVAMLLVTFLDVPPRQSPAPKMAQSLQPEVVLRKLLIKVD